MIGVTKSRQKYKASIRYGGTLKSLGTFDTKEQAGIAYDRFVIDKSTEEVSFTLNYPRMSDQEREEALEVEPPKKRKRGTPNPTTGLIGVSKNGKKYQASISYDGTAHYLGTFDTKEQAGIAYDRFVVGKSTATVSFILNYPNTTDPEREAGLSVEPHKIRKRGITNPTTGLIGVFESGKRYQAFLTFSGTRNNLGVFDTKEQAGMAYDRFVVDKSTEEFSFILNFPHGLPTRGTKKV